MVIAKTPNLMYMLNVQVTVNGWQTVPDRGVVRLCFWMAEFVLKTSPWRRWNIEMILVPVVHLRSSLLGSAITECWNWKYGQIWGFFLSTATQLTDPDKIRPVHVDQGSTLACQIRPRSWRGRYRSFILKFGRNYFWQFSPTWLSILIKLKFGMEGYSNLGMGCRMCRWPSCPCCNDHGSLLTVSSSFIQHIVRKVAEKLRETKGSSVKLSAVFAKLKPFCEFDETCFDIDFTVILQAKTKLV